MWLSQSQANLNFPGAAKAEGAHFLAPEMRIVSRKEKGTSP